VIGVALVDDQPLLRTGFRMILEAEADISVVGEAGDGDEGVAMVRTVRPDVVLMDIRMPGTNGIDATARIVREVPDSRVLILTTFDLDEYVFGALRAGASGFLLKDVRPAELLNAIRTVAAGEAVSRPARPAVSLSASCPRSTRHRHRSAPTCWPTLRNGNATSSSRSLPGGPTARSPVRCTSVKVHVSRVLTKLGLRDRVQAVILAYESAIVTRGGERL
jgi:DNA-binding NarL/FixJ family response regulator